MSSADSLPIKPSFNDILTELKAFEKDVELKDKMNYLMLNDAAQEIFDKRAAIWHKEYDMYLQSSSVHASSSSSSLSPACQNSNRPPVTFSGEINGDINISTVVTQ